jgi:signal transduction histidine kinase
MFIIDDIMDLSMIDAKQLKIRKEIFPLNQLFFDLKREYQKKADDLGIEFRLNLPVDEDIAIESDKFRIKQVCNYLINNAFKFTFAGFVEIGYSLKKKNIEFSVKDSGIGIASIHHHSIFERFRQVDTSKARRYGGNGLGLAISKKMVEMLGGKIWLESEEGRGSTFYFTLPNE